MPHNTYLIFGDLHGRILPAFRIALAWQREHEEPVSGVLQVGDLGFFPDWTRLDKATKRHAEQDPLELGASQIAFRNDEADALFAEAALSDLWFTPGNHEDFEALESLKHQAGSTRDEFFVDYYERVHCIRDGHVTTLPGGLRVGALWGIDDLAPSARSKTPKAARISQRSATELSTQKFDVLLTHESPRDAMLIDSGSDAILATIHLANPLFAFFGHYHGKDRFHECDFGSTQVVHLRGLEFRGRSDTAEAQSVGVLRWSETSASFEFVDAQWLATFTRHNWKYR